MLTYLGSLNRNDDHTENPINFIRLYYDDSANGKIIARNREGKDEAVDDVRPADSLEATLAAVRDRYGDDPAWCLEFAWDMRFVK